MKEFFAMGGFGFYIWVSYGAALLLMFAEPIVLMVSRRSVLRSVSRYARINAGRSGNSNDQ